MPAGTALTRALEIAEHLAGYSQGGIRADREAALATFGLSLQEGLDLEVEIFHGPPLSAEAVAGMRRFAEGSRPARRDP